MNKRKEQYSHQEMLEILRQVLYYGDPQTYEQGGVTGSINFPRGETYAKAERSFRKYYLKQDDESKV